MQDSNLRGAHHADHRFRDGCLSGLGQSSLFFVCPWQESNLHTRCGCPVLSRVRLPCFATGAGLPVQGSNLGKRIQNPWCCRLHQPGSRRGIGTAGAEPMEPLLGVEPSSSRLRDGCSGRLSSRGRMDTACGSGESNPDWTGPRPVASTCWARAALRSRRDSNPRSSPRQGAAVATGPREHLVFPGGVAARTGVEPAPSGVKTRRPSVRPTRCAPSRSRTCARRLRKPVLCPLSYRGEVMRVESGRADEHGRTPLLVPAAADATGTSSE